jgi:hypothetical protein
MFTDKSENFEPGVVFGSDNFGQKIFSAPKTTLGPNIFVIIRRFNRVPVFFADCDRLIIIWGAHRKY